MSIINQLVYNAKPKPQKLNILSLFYNGVFDIELLSTGHNFYGTLENSAYPFPGIKQNSFENLHLLPNLSLIGNIPVDLILFNCRERQENLFRLCRDLHAPGLIIDHNHVSTNWYFIKKHLEQFKIPSISTSEATNNQFSGKSCILYNIDTNTAQFEKDIDILLVGQFPQEVYGILVNLKNTFPKLRIIGNNPGLPFSEIVNDFKEYKNLFKRASIFINLPSISQQTNIPYELLWALDNKCAIITENVSSYEGLISDKNAVIIESPDYVIKELNNLLLNKTKYLQVTSHNTDLSKFKNNDFTKKWNEVLMEYSGVYYD